MPTYEYRCKDCGQDLEAQQAFTDDPLTECPACGGQLKKRFAAPGIAFKGSGFYKTDSRSGGSSRSSAGDSSSSSDTKGDGGGDGKAGTSGSGEGIGSSTPAKETTSTGTKASTPAASSSTTST